MLTFDEEKHEYRLDGNLLDGVTTVLRQAGFFPEYQPTDSEWFMDRGSIIHKVTELNDKGTLDESTVDPLIAGYLESWRKLGLKYTPGQIEIKLCDPVYLYAGTLDRHDCDIKSGAPAKWHRYQLGAYWGLKKLAGLGADPMSAVYLQEDGSMPKVVTYAVKDMMDALEVFKCALVVIRAKMEIT